MLTKKIGRKGRLKQTRTEKNADHTQIMQKIQVRSSFNVFKHLPLRKTDVLKTRQKSKFLGKKI